MQQHIKPFLFEDEQLVRVIMREGAPWFVVKDVCRILGIVNHRDVVKSLDEDEKGVASSDTLGGPQDLLVVAESGLYTIVLRSRDATKQGTPAHRFRKWVTAEVLPAIRRTGRYERLAPIEDMDGIEVEMGLRLKLQKINTACRCFGERAGAQMWVKSGLDIVPAMKAVLNQLDIFDLDEEVSGGPAN